MPPLEDLADRGVVQVGDVIDQSDVLLQQPQRPARVTGRRCRAGKGDQPGLNLPSHLRLHRRGEPLLPADRGLNVAAGVRVRSGDPHHGVHVHPGPLGNHHLGRNRAIPTWPVLIQLQQDPRPPNLLRLGRPGANTPGQQIPFPRTQRHRMRLQPRHHQLASDGPKGGKEPATTSPHHHRRELAATRY